ncbi:MAG: ADP-ribosylglycohydrolase family protein [Spirochaetaceae bacterium]
MERARAMVFAPFIGDSLSLGVHWVYNVKAIEKRVGRIDDLIAPVVKTFHPHKNAGEFTHYGDQMLLLLEYCNELCSDVENNEDCVSVKFDQSAFLKKWVAYMENYTGYMDHASKDTLAAYRKMPVNERDRGEDSAGSSMDDLAGASRCAPVVYYFRKNRAVAVEAAKSQAAVTHNEPSVIETAGFLAELSLRVLSDETPVDAALELVDGPYKDGSIEALVRRGIESADGDTTDVIGELGQACSVEKGLPSVMHLVSKYQDDIKEAFVASVSAGGDSAARNHAVGMVLGAYKGLGDIPKKWIDGLKAADKIEELL